MRNIDTERLAAPYPVSPQGHPQSDLAAALGWKIVPWRDVLQAVRADLDTTTFGIVWWKPSTETDDDLRRRLVVSDYLISVLEGAEHGLIELELHRLELLDNLERQGEFLRDALALGPRGEIMVDLPPRPSPTSDLPAAFIDLHMNGFLRAGATVFDCLAGAIVLICALDIDVLRTDWGKVGKKLELPRSGSTPRDQLWASTKSALDRTMAASAVEGWHEWLLAYRNLIVHRGHRLKLSQITPVPSLYAPDGRRLIRARVSPVVPSDPEVTDIEALGMAHQHSPVLEEDVRRTVDGLCLDLRRVVADLGAFLLDTWRSRRANPGSVPQPFRQQWRTVRRSKQHHFSGYHPGSRPFRPSSFTMDPNFARRMQAASLIDPYAALWRRP